MPQEITIIPRSLRTYSATWANRPISDLMIGDLYYCTDRKVFYRWDGSAFNAQSYYVASGLLSARPAATNLPDGSQYYATDTAVNYQASGGAWILTSSLAAKWSGATVFNSTVPTGWTDLDLSAIIGAKQTLVILRVTNVAGAAEAINIRPKGDTGGISTSAYNEHAAACSLAGAGAAAILVCTTDANGVLQWNGSYPTYETVTIKLLVYIN